MPKPPIRMPGTGVKRYLTSCRGRSSLEIALVWYRGIAGRIATLVRPSLHWRSDERYAPSLFTTTPLLLSATILLSCSSTWHCPLLNTEKVFWTPAVGYLFWTVLISLASTTTLPPTFQSHHHVHSTWPVIPRQEIQRAVLQLRKRSLDVGLPRTAETDYGRHSALAVAASRARWFQP